MAQKIVVASGKGGVGKTTLVVAVAQALAADSHSVLIIDCDNLGGIDIILGAQETVVYNWGDVILDRCSLNDAVYRTGDIYLMPGPRDYEGVTVQRIKQLISSLDNQFDYIFLDSPAGIQLGFIVALVAADRGLVVSTADSVSARSAFLTAQAMNKYGMRDVRLIINRVVKRDITKRGFLNIDSMIDRTQIKLIGVVPEDRHLRLCPTGGRAYKKGWQSYKAISNIAARIQGNDIPLEF